TALKSGATAAKIGFNHGESISVSFESGRLKKTGASETARYAIEVLVDSKRGATTGNDLDGFDDMITRAIALAKVGGAAHFDAYPAPAEFAKIASHSPRTLELTREGIIQNCQSMVDRLKAYNSEMDIQSGGNRKESEGLLVTSGGVCQSHKSTAWSLFAGVQKTEGTDMLFSDYGRSWGDRNSFYDPDYIVEQVLWDLKNGEKIVSPPTGKCQAYLPPEILYTLLSPILMGVNGRHVAKGDSPLKGRLGDTIMDSCLTIVDDPHRDFNNESTDLDSDGVATRKNTIFENGVLKTFLYDLDSAGLAGAEPTGNDHCSPYSVVLTPGDTSSEELLAGIEDGVYLKELIGFGTSNIMNGDFSCNVGLGYRVKNGKVVGRIKNTMIAGNAYELFKRNVALSSDVEPTSLLPYAVINGIGVSSAE
ncbi:MAG: TldD/PmbA family protein, partial [Planctomycetes bacterium]|nr:TldD/PmbA family protein [Planctomycetota bacterium]